MSVAAPPPPWQANSDSQPPDPYRLSERWQPLVFSPRTLSGNITGTQTRSLNGDIAYETFTGTAIVNPDCTGTDTIRVFEGGVLVRTTALHVVYDDDGREARAVFTSLVLPDGTSLPSIITIEARRLFPGKSD
jgi:hypothetical protein